VLWELRGNRRPCEDLGAEPAAADFAVVPGHAYLIEVGQRNNDALVEILDPMNESLSGPTIPSDGQEPGVLW